MDFIKYVIENDYGEVLSNASFKSLSTIGCGGEIKYLYFPKNVESLCKVFQFLNYFNMKFFVIGNGSNILPKSDFFDGVVITIKSLEKYIRVYDDHVICSANIQASNLANKLAELNVGDLSFLGGIPGNIGGCINQNSGAYGDEIKNHIIEVKYIDAEGNIKIIKNEELNFSYRYSIFKEIKGIIIEAKFKIEKNVETKSVLQKRLLSRKTSQPLEYKNMGSVFKNPEGLKAWEVIDKLDLRGYKINDAAVSEKHTNFLINLDSAKAEDFIDMINLIKDKAKKEMNVILEQEIIIVE